MQQIGRQARESFADRLRGDEPFRFAEGGFTPAGLKSIASTMWREPERQKLERLAEFSPRHADMLRGLVRTERANLQSQDLREWCAAISSPNDTNLQRSLKKRSPSGTVPNSIDRLGDSLLSEEKDWDPAKHPRAPKGQPEGGRWINREGSEEGSERKRLPIKRAIHSARNRVGIDLISREVVGHHWVPFGAVHHPDIRPFITDDAADYAAGAISGPLDPPHNGRTIYKVPHSKYTADVKKQLKLFFDLNGVTETTKMTVEQMRQFVDYVENGLGGNGKSHHRIRMFNLGIKKMVKKGVVVPKSIKDILALGKRQISARGFKLIAAAAVLSGMIGDAIADEVKMLDIASENRHFLDAIAALERGDLADAQNLLVGDTDSFVVDLAGHVNAAAILNFIKVMEKAFAEIPKHNFE
jgi:hypothetical protein